MTVTQSNLPIGKYDTLQIVNDLLDPGRPALRLREDRRRGSYVEGAREETLLDAEHALALIAAGDANRKVRPFAWLAL